MQCAVCHLEAIYRCQKCKVVAYCSLSCQRDHWQQQHQRRCKGFSFFNFGVSRSKFCKTDLEIARAVVVAMESGHLSIDQVSILGHPFYETILDWNFGTMQCETVLEIWDRCLALNPPLDQFWEVIQQVRPSKLKHRVKAWAARKACLWEYLEAAVDSRFLQNWVRKELGRRQWLRSARRAWIAAVVVF